MEEKTLATELLHEVKASAKRWFVIAIVELLIITLLVGGILWLLGLPVEEVALDNESGVAAYVGNDMNGVIHNGTSDGQETSSAR